MGLLTGQVPAGWPERPLGEVCELVAGPRTDRNAPDGTESWPVPVVGPKDLRHNRIARNCTTTVPEHVAHRLSRYRLHPDDIVVARTGQPDHQGLATPEQYGWLFSSACLRLRVVDGAVSPRYLAQYLGHPAVRDWIVRNTGGSIMPTLTTKLLGALPVAVPPEDVQAGVADVLGALDEKAMVHEEISRTTAELHDALRLRLLADNPINW
ncbi:MAG TPA: restriction endonuclease subunit S [Actinophytocola sp.]|jgi:hypothetical protein|nr:restriction endonuclease subunit S [Actinophytocola sp.]